jgi:hypothetical protein
MRLFGQSFVDSRTIRLDMLQGFLIGVGLAFVTAQAIGEASNPSLLTFAAPKIELLYGIP